MFEYHGWAVVRATPNDTGNDDQVWQQLREHVAELPRWTEWLSFGDPLNGLNSFTVSGLRNHRQEYVVGIFEWLAEYAPGSYGLLYTLDDEQKLYNHFRVWRLARGTLEECDDPFLSPYVPTVEDPYVGGD